MSKVPCPSEEDIIGAYPALGFSPGKRPVETDEGGDGGETGADMLEGWEDGYVA